jgi:hypothetical protein
VTLNRVLIVKQIGVPAAKIVSYEVGNRSFDTLLGQSARVADASYFELSPPCMAAVGCVRLIGDAIALDPAISALVAADQGILDQLTPMLMPARGGFSVMTSDGQSLTQFCSNHAVAVAKITSALSDPKTSLLAFFNRHDLAKFGGFQFSWGVAAHHFFVAEVAHELTQ